MGLDIYLYKTKRKGNNIDTIYVKDNEQAKKKFKEHFQKFVLKIQAEELSRTNAMSQKELDTIDNNIQKVYDKLMAFIKDSFNYDFYYKKLLDERHNSAQLIDWYKTSQSGIYMIETLYYRKVNFLFRFFSEHETMIDNNCCWVSKESVQTLVDTCNEVLNDKDNSDNILPTCSGFFFGSTAYDEYYYDDVERVRNDYQALLDSWDDNERLYMIFSY